MTFPLASNNFNTSPVQDLQKAFKEGQIVQEQMIKKNSWLEKGHPLGDLKGSMDLKLLGLVDGDSFITGTPLEGYTPSESLNYYVGVTEQMLQRADENPD